MRDGIQQRAAVKHTPGFMATALNLSLATSQWWTISTHIVLEKVLQRRIYKIFSKYNKTHLHGTIGQALLPDFFLKYPLMKRCSRLHHRSYSCCALNQFRHGASSNVALLHNPLEHQHPEGKLAQTEARDGPAE